MLGYWNDAVKTQDSITPDRWYKTGYLKIVLNVAMILLFLVDFLLFLSFGAEILV